MIRMRLRLTGAVQGVGLRWQARHAAALAGVTGWVRNDPDGGVTLELQGVEAQLEQALRLLEEGRFLRIDGMETQRIPTVPEERGFAVLDDRW